MSEIFQLSFDRLQEDPKAQSLAKALAGHTTIASEADFNNFCRSACRHWNQLMGDRSGQSDAHFAELAQKISEGKESTIPTSWGGVVITLHEHPRVEKYLVVKKGTYLALEKHEQKDEKLEIKTGAGLLLRRLSANNSLTVESLEPGKHFHFSPGIEHCVIGTEDLLVFERSIDPKGMDKDLIFIYQPEQQ